MATARRVVNLALQKLGVLGAGREARNADATDALAALQGLYGSWIAAGAFGRLTDVVPVTGPYMACGNEHIYRTTENVIEVQLPELVATGWFNDYGWFRCCGYYSPNKPPRDGMVVRITDAKGGETRTWLYDGAVKEWQPTDAVMTLDDEAPRSTADPQGLAACLAIEISDFYGDAAVIGAATAQQAARFKVAMTQGFGAERQPVAGVYY